ncbi:MAG: carbon starvation protein A [Planctomycetes bacterium]|nr:carbon starvation protein A [Planctomycetota bacterium]
MAALVAASVLLAFFLGYRFYARWLGRRVFGTEADADGDDTEFVTPAHRLEDGMDYVPTTKHVLFGHHFTSIAGAAPIIGPCIAAYWGWLPALLWVVLGAIFMGAVHDYAALVASVRERGRTIADLTSTVLSKRAGVMFLCFVLVLSWLVLAVFAMAIAQLFISTPSSVLPINIEIVVALAIGWLIYKKKVPPLIPSLVALATLYVFVWIGTKAPISFADFGMSKDDEKVTWLLLLFAYSIVASLLPVWTLLQPRDYINSHQLFVGLALLFGGLFIAAPAFDAPAIRTASDGAPGIFPLLFVTIACGAISGFHGLVASGTTSKQVDHLRDTRFIGYGAMLGEGCLALAATMAVVAGLGLLEDKSWMACYHDFGAASKGAIGNFRDGGAALLYAIGIPSELATTLMAVLVISFAATTLDTATRIERFLVQELGSALDIVPLKNRFIATLVAVIPGIVLAMWTVEDPATGTIREAAWVLWPIFGASNQMLAALTLLTLSLYFWRKNKPVWPLAIPMVFIMGITLTSLLAKTMEFYGQKNWLLVGISTVLTTLVLWMLVEAVAVLKGVSNRGADDTPR